MSRKRAKKAGAYRNLEELVTATRQFSYQDEDEDLMPLQAFLSHAALEAGEGRGQMAGCGAADDAALGERAGVQPVFIVGMEEGMFPSQMSLDEGGRLEEERRGVCRRDARDGEADAYLR